MDLWKATFITGRTGHRFLYALGRDVTELLYRGESVVNIKDNAVHDAKLLTASEFFIQRLDGLFQFWVKREGDTWKWTNWD